MSSLRAPAAPVRGTLHLVVFLTLVAGILFAAFRTYSQEKQLVREQFHKYLGDLVGLKVNELNEWLEERKGDALVARRDSAMMPELEVALRGAPEAREHVLQWMEVIRQSYKCASVTLLDSADTIRLTSGSSLADQEIYKALGRQTTDNGQVLFLYYPRSAGVVRSHFTVSTSLFSHSGVHLGTLILGLDPWVSPFPEVLKWTSGKRTGKVFLVRRENGAVRVIGVGSRESGAKPEEVVIPLSQQTSPFVRAVMVRNGSVDGLGDSGRPVAAVVKAMNSSGEPAFIVASMDENEAYAAVRETAILLALASGLLIALSGGGVLWIWRQQVLHFWRQQLSAERERKELIGHYDYLTRFANDAVLLSVIEGDGGPVVQVNERATEIYGYSREEMLRMNVRELRAPGTKPEYDRARLALEKQKSVVFETLARRRDGSIFPVEHSVRVVEVDGVEYRQSMARDITERKKTQQQIARLNRLYAVVSRCGQAIVTAPTESVLFEELVGIAADCGGFSIAAIGMLAQETGKIGTVARAGASAGYLDEIAAIPHGASVDLRSTGQSLWEAGAVICNDLWQANAIPGGVKAVEAAQKFNVRSYLLLPLCCERGLVGELRLYAAEPGFFSAEEKKLATEVAESICFALESLERKRKQQKVETELRMNRERLELVLDATQDAYGDWNLESGDIQENPRYDALLGYEPYELPRRSEDHYSRIHPDDAARVARGIREFEASGKDLYSDEYRMRCKSGEYIWVFCRAKVVRRTPGGLPARVVGTLADITDRKKLEDQFRQAQKLESMGRLAGGVAHDFNNLLTVINGYSALLMTRSSEADPARRQLAEIRMAGERAAELTRQLLTFSRNSVTEPRLLKLNAAAADSENLLRRLTPDNIDFEASFEALRDEVVIDPGQVQQVLMNLVVNACDAMPAGGRLTVRTANLEVTPGDVPEDSVLTSGAYVLLEVTDTGTGMDEETIRHIFEPFFTTKDVGKGTGLGLSTVYGIVRQCGGFVRVESAPGAGSKFRIHFPLAADGILPHGAPLKGAAGKMTGSETVLVVEDQDTVRNFAVETLRTYGYSVLAARSGAEALEMAKQQAGPVDLLLTDVVMPSMNGKTVEQELRKTRPATKVIYMSGYADETAGVAAEIGPETGYLQKPFSPEALAAKVRCALDRAAVSHTILVVEDEEAVRAVFEEFLGKKHKLLLACNGRDALRMLQAGPMPDLVVTDLVMPDMEGVETIREIRRRLPGTKIIAMSGAFGGQFLKTAELLGADATLAKPIHPEVLDQMIEDVLARVSSN